MLFSVVELGDTAYTLCKCPVRELWQVPLTQDILGTPETCGQRWPQLFQLGTERAF